MFDKYKLVEKLVIRPSAVERFFACPFAWFYSHVLPSTSIKEDKKYSWKIGHNEGYSNERAAIGTAIHKAVELFWNGEKSKDKLLEEAIKTFEKETAKVEVDLEVAKEDIQYGIEAYVDTIAPWACEVTQTETRYTLELEDHPTVKSISGTVDLYNEKHGILMDVKTSKGVISPRAHQIQQGIYKKIVEAAGNKVEANLLHNISFNDTLGASGTVEICEIDMERVDEHLNILLKTLKYIDKVPHSVLFRPNPKAAYCNEEFCPAWEHCPLRK